MRILMFFIMATTLFSCSNAAKSPRAVKPAKNIDWAQGIVWYQIFPERFYNGDTTNDPTPQEVPGSELQPGWRIHPWTSDWYRLQPWERKQSDNFYDVVFTRRYGGDLIGVEKKLDYLQKLGIDAIYFNPVFESPSLHKYDGCGYHHIDNNFGPDAQGDLRRIKAAHENENPKTWIWTKADSAFLHLIQEAHARGIRIVIDGVFNHTGTCCFAFQDVLKHQEKSKYANWYTILRWDDPTTPQNEFDYKGWWGVKSLPELKEDANGIVHGPREYIFNCTRRWMDPNGDGDPSDGIDGWRLDVAEEVAKPFWKEWQALVKSINPGAITVTEIWHDASGWIKDSLTDATMNYEFARTVKNFFIDKKKAISAQQFAARFQEMQKRYGFAVFNRLWSMLDSHDTDRLASQILNPDHPYNHENSPRNNPDYLVRKPNAFERKIQKQIVAFQMLFAGSPIIYYGDEAGMWGATDPDDRKPMVWPDMRFEPESHHPLPGKTRPVDSVKFNRNLFAFYQKLIALRHTLPVIRKGNVQFLATHNKDVALFARESEEQILVAFFNRSANEQSVALPEAAWKGKAFENLWEGKTLNWVAGQKIQIPGKGFLIFVSDK